MRRPMRGSVTVDSTILQFSRSLKVAGDISLFFACRAGYRTGILIMRLSIDSLRSGYSPHTLEYQKTCRCLSPNLGPDNTPRWRLGGRGWCLPMPVRSPLQPRRCLGGRGDYGRVLPSPPRTHSNLE